MNVFVKIIRGTTTQQKCFNFVTGIVLGIVVSRLVILLATGDRNQISSVTGNNVGIGGDGYRGRSIDQQKASDGDPSFMKGHGNSIMLGEDEIRNWMSKRTSILCWILTHPGNLDKKAIHVRATWSKRCTKVLYMSSEETDFPTIAIVDQEGRKVLWAKTRGTHQYIYDRFIDQFDWFLKADDDTYVIMENLRRLLGQYDPNKPIFFGRRFRPHVAQGYMSGGAGYVLSREAVRLLVEKAFPDPELCPPISTLGVSEDVVIGRCLMNIGIKPGDSRVEGRESFHSYAPIEMLNPERFKATHWFSRYNYYPLKKGLECCSNYSISFHYVSGEVMHQVEYMIYRMRPFGVGYYTCPDDIQSYLQVISRKMRTY